VNSKCDEDEKIEMRRWFLLCSREGSFIMLAQTIDFLEMGFNSGLARDSLLQEQEDERPVVPQGSMDAHFSKLLGGTPSASSSQSASQIPFMPATAFEGRREGYKFQKGSKGLGYYYDRLQVKASSIPSNTEASHAEVSFIIAYTRYKSDFLIHESTYHQDDGADGRKRKREGTLHTSSPIVRTPTYRILTYRCALYESRGGWRRRGRRGRQAQY
jgi:hypothetical protein